MEKALLSVKLNKKEKIRGIKYAEKGKDYVK